MCCVCAAGWPRRRAVRSRHRHARRYRGRSMLGMLASRRSRYRSERVARRGPQWLCRSVLACYIAMQAACHVVTVGILGKELYRNPAACQVRRNPCQRGHGLCPGGHELEATSRSWKPPKVRRRRMHRSRGFVPTSRAGARTPICRSPGQLIFHANRPVRFSSGAVGISGGFFRGLPEVSTFEDSVLN